MKNNDEAQDWRLDAPHNYLYGKTAIYEKFKSREDWDHVHCCFCWETISSDDCDLNYGYHLTEIENWICEECFKDFHTMFAIEDITNKGSEI